MTKDEVVQVAKAVDPFIFTYSFREATYDFTKEQLCEFAAIIEKRTIERCAAVCESITFTLNDGIDGDWEWGQEAGAKRCAAAIRALGEQ